MGIGRRRAAGWLLAGLLAVVAVLGLAPGVHAQGPVLTDHEPVTNSVTAPLDSNIVLTYSTEISVATVTSRTVVVHSMMQGLVTATHSTEGSAVTVAPNRAFFPGETVFSMATTQVTDLGGTHAPKSSQWQFTTGAIGGTGQFAVRPVKAGDTAPQCAAVGDFDGDGNLDMAVGGYAKPDIVYFGDGAGGFPRSTVVDSASDYAGVVVAGDLNSDGALDLVIGHVSGTTRAYLNNRSGGFGSAVWSSSSVTNLRDVILGDFDNDGDLDLIVSGGGSGSETLYRNTGNGIFSSAGSLYTGVAETFATGDFDGDGDLDLATGSSYNNQIFLNDGNFTLSYAGLFGTAPNSTYSLVVSDYDGDGDLDIAAGNYSQPSVVYFNNGAGAFANPMGLGRASSGLVTADAEGDGDLDIISWNYTGGNTLFLNNGSGTFEESLQIAPGGSIMAAGDYDGDGDLDLAGIGNAKSAIYWNAAPKELTGYSPLPNAIDVGVDSSVVFTYSLQLDAGTVTSHTVAVHSMMQGLVTATHTVAGNVVTVTPTRSFLPGELVYAVATLATDGITDTQLYTPTVWQFSAAPSKGYGSFYHTPKQFGADTDATSSVAWGDFDGDGDLDLAVGNDGGQNAVYLNNGDGSFGSSVTFGSGVDATRSVAWGDFDGDGDLDLAAGNYGGQNAVYTNNGDGTLGAPINFGTGTDATNVVAWSDMDGDGDLDLTAADSIVTQYFNSGTGVFIETSTFNAGNPVSTLAWGDFDNDGDLDLALGTGGGGQDYIRIANGDGTFDGWIYLGPNTTPTVSMAWGDYDSDGDLDLAIGYRYSSSYNAIAIYPSNGDGTLGDPVEIEGLVGKYLASLAWGDFDADGDLDLAVGSNDAYPTSAFEGQNFILVNDGAGTFGSRIPFGDGNEDTVGLAWGDADGDGSLDLAVGNTGQPSGVYLNGPRLDLTDFSPSRNSPAAVDSRVVLTYSADINAASVTSRTVVVHSMMQGIVTATYSTAGNVVTVTPHRPFLAGEPVNATATTHTTSITDTHLITPTIWQFNAPPTAGFGWLHFAPLPVGSSGSTGGWAGAMAWGDFDGDGDLDLALGVDGGQNAVYLNDGDGSFGSSVAFGSGTDATRGVAWADYDGDGDLDLAVSNGWDRVVIYPNNGNGTFGATVDLGSGGGPIAWGDFDGDGRLDLARLGSIDFNQGDGTFVQEWFSLSGGADSLAVGDFNNDSRLDLAFGSYSSQSYLYLNLGDGRFTSGIAFGSSTDPAYRLAAADFDNDGDLDLAAGGYQTQDVLYLNSGDGVFGSAINFGTGTDSTQALAWGDFDADGDVDLATANNVECLIYPNNGAGGFGAPVAIGATHAANALAWGDVNGDGTLDLATALQGALVFLNVAPMTLDDAAPARNTSAASLGASVVFTFSQEIEAATVTSRTVLVHAMQQGLITATHVSSGNVVTVTPNRPFLPGELVYAAPNYRVAGASGGRLYSPAIMQFYAEAPAGYGHFGESPVAVGVSNSRTHAVAWADYDGDGDVDLAFGNDYQNMVYPNNGDGTFGAAVNVGPNSDSTYSIAWGDYDNDGDLDLAMGNYGTQSAVYPNNGAGGFGAKVNFGYSSASTRSVAWGDYDGDGDLDLAVGNTNYQQNYLYPNNGNGTFGSAISLPTYMSDSTNSVAWGDYDNDGDLDLAVGNEGRNYLYPNNGNGTFADPIEPDADYGDWGTRSVLWGDFNGDGNLDLVLGNDGVQSMILPGNGDGTFMAPVYFGTASSLRSLAAGDFDGDGDLDLAEGNEYAKNAISLNNGDGTFGDPILFGSTTGETGSVAWADFDNDGALDLAEGANYYQNFVYVNTPSLDLAISQSVKPVMAVPGDTVTYTLAFSNAGTAAVSGVVITNSIPASLTVQNVISSGVALTNVGTPQPYVWNIASLAGGQGGVITITANVDSSAAWTLTATAQIASGALEGSLANNSSNATLAIDSDHDGLSDVVEGGGDTDSDGTPNYLDTDSDNDGVSDTDETTNGSDRLNPDDPTSGGGNDEDSDGLTNGQEGFDPNHDGNTGDARDTDSDGTPDYQDADSDNDGVSDADETTNGSDPYDPDDPTTGGGGDADNDGLTNGQEGFDPNHDGNTGDARDTDSDGTPDYQDSDSDNDSVSDVDETTNGSDPYDPDDPTSGGGNDDDNDGLTNGQEGFDPNHDGNTGDARDTDSDGTPDYQDTDSDNDGVSDADETTNGSDRLNSNDPTTGGGNDADNDGLTNGQEGFDPNHDGNTGDARDTDSDGTPDYQDTDSDNDGVSDADETTNGSDPYDADDPTSDGGSDADNDGLTNGQEGFDPNHDGNTDDARDTDSDGTPDYQDTDSDNDGVTDADETTNGSDPYNANDPTSGGGGDADNDGLTNGQEGFDPNHDGNTGDARDTDSDGTPDYQDTDSDNDGVSDADETTNGSDPYNANDPTTGGGGDADNDGLTNGREGFDPNHDGNTGDARDTDSDGTPDYQDTDSDNDGGSDADETTGGSDPYDADDPTTGGGNDDDNDGLTNGQEGFDPNHDGNTSDARDTDSDGTPDYQDTDSDNDGIPDRNDSTPTEPNPLAINDAVGVQDGEAVDVPVLANDHSPFGGLVVAQISQPLHGTATINSDNVTVHYLAPSGYGGSDRFTYTLRDSKGMTSTATVAVVVTNGSQSDARPQIAVVTPGIQGTGHFTGGHVSLSVNVPAGAYTATLAPQDIFYLVFTALLNPTGGINHLPSEVTFGNIVFDLSAYVSTALQEGYRFAEPVTVVITYDPAQLNGLDEALLTLMRWDGAAWSSDGIAIVGRNADAHTLTVSVNRLGEFALFGQDTPVTYAYYQYLSVVANANNLAEVREAALSEERPDEATAHNTETEVVATPSPNVEAPAAVDSGISDEEPIPTPDEAVAPTTTDQLPAVVQADEPATDETSDAPNATPRLHLPLVAR